MFGEQTLAQLRRGFTSTVQCCSTSTQTIRAITDRELKTAALTFTHLLSSECRIIPNKF